jgi:tetratricopeptide (TPR) repeat protein
MKFGAALFLASWLLTASPIDQCRALQHHGKLDAAHSCFANLTRSGDAFTRGEAFFGLEQYEQANDEFREADRAHPNSAAVKTEWGKVYAEHAQGGDAAKLFEEAIEADSNYAPAYLGLAQVLAENFDKNAVILAHQALQHDPKMAEAHEFLAYLALEDNDDKQATEEAKQALALSSESLDSMAVLASIDWMNATVESDWMKRALAINPVYGEGYATGAHFFVINRRYEEGIAYYRKALALNPDLWSARSQLGINLMRLGEDDAAKQELTRCYNAHFRDPQTVNALRLLDTIGDYQTFQTPSTQLLLNKNEAALLRPYIEPELERAIKTYQHKYQMTLPGPVRLEVFPNHEDFIVRTLGLPGQGGLLGVTFGTVVAMDSPSARPPGEFNWASTMWHELSHVYVVTETHHLVPRWFTEGLAVHEEGAASPDWGDRLTPDIVAALQQKKLLPVLELDRGFLRPDYPNQVLVSYYQAGKICDYIVQKWGDTAILGMIHSYTERKTTAEALAANLHEDGPTFDKEFAAWLDKQTGATVKHFDDFKNGMRAAYESLKNGKKDEAVQKARSLIAYYPEYSGDQSPYELIAKVDLDGGNKVQAAQELEHLRDIGSTNPELLKSLAHLEQETGRTKQAITTLEKINYIYPEDEEVHRRLGSLLFDVGEIQPSIREFRASLALKPDDVAGSHYNLARALNAAHQTSEAKDQVLLALEAAPGFKPAQQLLLQLSQ